MFNLFETIIFDFIYVYALIWFIHYFINCSVFNMSYSNFRYWVGVNDLVHPLARVGHFSVTSGRYIYVYNGYAQVDQVSILIFLLIYTNYF